MSDPKVGWGAVVLGEPIELANWASVLKEPFDPWIEVHGDETVLRSASLDQLTSATEVRDRSIAQIERLNGAMALSQGSKPLRFGGVIQFTVDGRLHRTVFAEMAAFEVGGKMHAIATVIGPDGKLVPPPPPQPSEVQRWMAIADGDGLLEDTLIYFGKAVDWFDIYNALECLILRFGGGSERAFLARAWGPEPDVVRLKQTANWARHARRKFDPPQNPMALEDARRLLGQLVRRAFIEMGPSQAP
jgi:hypothetical protein